MCKDFPSPPLERWVEAVSSSIQDHRDGCQVIAQRVCVAITRNGNVVGWYLTPPLGNLNVRGRVALSPKNRETVRRNGSKQS